MKNLKFKTTLVDAYFELLRNFSDSTKEALINRLKKSMKNNNKQEPFSLFGSWNSNNTAEEIIADIENNRHTEREIDTL